MWTCLIMSDTYVLKYGLLDNIITASRVSQCLSSSHIHSVSSASNWLYFSYWIQTLSLVFIANVLYEVVNEINITGQHCILSSFSLLKMSARDKSKHNHAFSEILLMVLLPWGIFFFLVSFERFVARLGLGRTKVTSIEKWILEPQCETTNTTKNSPL